MKYTIKTYSEKYSRWEHLTTVEAPSVFEALKTYGQRTKLPEAGLLLLANGEDSPALATFRLWRGYDGSPTTERVTP